MYHLYPLPVYVVQIMSRPQESTELEEMKPTVDAVFEK